MAKGRSSHGLTTSVSPIEQLPGRVLCVQEVAGAIANMQSGVRAVEAYRRAVLIDGATSDNDSVAPVYKLEEICTLMRTSSLDIVRELVERILKRMDHKSPIVKQKVCRSSSIDSHGRTLI